MARFNRSFVPKVVAGICAFLVFYRVLSSSTCSIVPATSTTSRQYDVIEGAEPRVVRGVAGQAKWTISIPRNSSFPLRGDQYAKLCHEGQQARDDYVQASRMASVTSLHRAPSYYARDWTYLDVEETHGAAGLRDAKGTGICDTSLTFVMDTQDASFGRTLLLLWMSYGLAKKEGRAFFVDDTRWPYGKYTSFFKPPPAQSCSAPSAHHIVPYPHQAKHLVVSTATAPWTFGPLFDREFTPRRYDGGRHSKPLFDLLRKGYEDLFELTGEDRNYADDRSLNLRVAADLHHGSVVGMHIRRGDQHPFEYQFSRDYLPVERYASAMNDVLDRLFQDKVRTLLHRGNGVAAVVDFARSPVLLASDDPDLLSHSDLSHAVSPYKVQRSQERIQMATKATLDISNPRRPIREPGSAYVKHVDENAGWEGGFFSALFYSLGAIKRSPGEDTHEMPEPAMRMRELVGRAYLLDLAVLGKSDGLVCAVSSAACRILGVMMGWDAVAEGRWVNVDDGRPWSWDGRR